MAPDLRFVPHTAKRHPHEPPAHGTGDTLPKARLADTGRSHEAEDRIARIAGVAPAFLTQLLDGEVLEDPVLDLLQVEVILVEDLTGPADVDHHAAQRAPRQARHPFEIRDDHAMLRRRG